MTQHDAIFTLIFIAACLAAHFGARYIAEAIYRYRTFNRIAGYSRVQPAIYKDWWVK